MKRSPSQSQDEFEKFSELNLDSLVQNNPFLVVVIGDFNAKLKNWYKKKAKCSFEGNIIENVTWQFGLQQVIKESTHVLDNSSSCIDLVFTSQENLVIKSGVHPSRIQIAITRLFIQNLTCRLFTLLIYVKYGIIKMQNRAYQTSYYNV